MKVLRETKRLEHHDTVGGALLLREVPRWGA